MVSELSDNTSKTLGNLNPNFEYFPSVAVDHGVTVTIVVAELADVTS